MVRDGVMLKAFGFFLFFSAFANLVGAQINLKFEAEEAVLSGNAEIVSCGNASGGKMVKGLDNGQANAVNFTRISLDQAGEYFVTISYYSVSDRNLNYKLNDETAKTEPVSASGDWCYQGGVPAESIFKVNFAQGDNSILFYNSPIIDRIAISSDTASRVASSIYVSSTTGNDNNDGLTPETALQSLGAVNDLKLLPGDTILFKSGDTFKGELLVVSESGAEGKPIHFSSYGEGDLPILDGDGYLSTIHALNSEYLSFSNLEIKNDGGPAKPGDSEDVRYGIYFQNSFSDGTVYKHFRMNGLVFKNIYPTTQISDNDQTGVNAHAIFTSGSWGDEVHPLRFEDMEVSNCYFTRTARHALVIKSTKDLVISNNLFEHVGGAGMVIGYACKDILVEKNITDHTGSSIDSRMAGRGSGLWCFRATNLTAQHNHFMFARGIHDSYGMHIDIGNRNVVYQYNYSVGNEGGFVEILGMNVNVGYRYNLSIADGWRKRGNRYGQVFWLAGWSGDPKNPVGSDSIFVYNNSVYVPDTIAPGIWIENVSKNARIYNNIVSVANEFGPVVIRNNAYYNDFDYNIWHGSIPDMDEDGDSYWGANALTTDPLFKDAAVKDSAGFLLQTASPAIGSGKLIYDETVSEDFDGYDNNGGLDYFGEAVSNTQAPNRGADNSDALTAVYLNLKSDKNFKVYPNPVRKGQKLYLKLNNNQQYSSIEIVDMLGKVWLVQKEFNKQENQFDTGDLLPGLYILKVNSEQGVYSKSFIVN